jgi:hypothetical protein
MELAVFDRSAKVTVLLDAIVLAVSWLLILTVLVLDLVGILRRGTGFRCQQVGVLIAVTAGSVIGFAHFRSWPDSRIVALQSIALPVMLVGLAVSGVGVAIQVVERRKRA